MKRFPSPRLASLAIHYRIEVDGGINEATAVTARNAGADTLVVGTSTYRADDMAEAIRKMRGL